MNGGSILAFRPGDANSPADNHVCIRCFVPLLLVPDHVVHSLLVGLLLQYGGLFLVPHSVSTTATAVDLEIFVLFWALSERSSVLSMTTHSNYTTNHKSLCLFLSSQVFGDGVALVHDIDGNGCVPT